MTGLVLTTITSTMPCDTGRVECEWDTFIDGELCDVAATQVILNTNDRDSHFPDGFHWAHLCDLHAPLGIPPDNDVPSTPPYLKDR